MFDRRSLTAEPARLVMLLVAVHIAAWWLAMAPFHSAPPTDMVESLYWGAEWPIGTYKHPPFLAWTLETFWQIGGYWGIAFAATLPIAVSYWLVWEIGRRLLSPREALIGTLMTVGLYYFGWPTGEVNHNTIQMPFFLGIILLTWRCMEKPTVGRWLALGAFAGVALYSKYSIVVIYAAVALWLLVDARGRRALLTPGLWLGVGAFALIASPQIIWLVQNHFIPFRYFSEATSHAEEILLGFALVQFAVALPIVMLRTVAGMPRFRRIRHEDFRYEDKFLVFFALVPVTLTLLGAFAANKTLHPMWATPMLSLWGLCLARLSRPVTEQQLRRLAVAAFCLLLVFPIAWLGVVKFGPLPGAGLARMNWPQREIARQVAELAVRETGQPAGVIAGDNFAAGLAALTGPPTGPTGRRPKVMVNGDRAASPWVTDADLAGTVAIVTQRPAFAGGAESLWVSRGKPTLHELTIPVTSSRVRSVKILVAILPPTGSGAANAAAAR